MIFLRRRWAQQPTQWGPYTAVRRALSYNLERYGVDPASCYIAVPLWELGGTDARNYGRAGEVGTVAGSAAWNSNRGVDFSSSGNVALSSNDAYDQMTGFTIVVGAYFSDTAKSEALFSLGTNQGSFLFGQYGWIVKPWLRVYDYDSWSLVDVYGTSGDLLDNEEAVFAGVFRSEGSCSTFYRGEVTDTQTATGVTVTGKSSFTPYIGMVSGGSRPWKQDIYWVLFFNKAHPNEVISDLMTGPSVFHKVPVRTYSIPSGATVINVSAGTLTTTGAALYVGEGVNVEDGSLTLTGKELTVLTGVTETVNKGDLTLTGQDAAASVTYTPETASLSVSGLQLYLWDKQTPTAGSLTLTGQDATANVGEVINVTNGSLTLSGKDLTVKAIFTAQTGELSIAGGSVITDSGLVPEAGVLLVSGQSASVYVDETYTLGSGALSTTGQDAQLSLSILVDGQSLNTTGEDAFLADIEDISNGSMSLVGATVGLNDVALIEKAHINVIGRTVTIEGEVTSVNTLLRVVRNVVQPVCKKPFKGD